jgi:hypothetical protein
MSTHTPGPWNARRAPKETEVASVGGIEVSLSRGDQWAIDADDRWIELATVYTSGGEFETTSEANARLIAAAPDLLAALKDVLDLLDEWMRDNTGSRELELLERCEAAIAKAEGQS